MEEEEKVLKAVLIHFFGKYPYLLQYISLPEISKRTTVDLEIVEKILNTIWKEAQEEEKKELKRRGKRLFEEEEECYLCFLYE